MTVTNNVSTEVEVAVDHITVVIDGVEMRVPKGTLVIRAAEQLGIEIPRFCDHPLLEPVAACRACLIEIDGMPKPQPACAQVLSDGMQVHTQQSSEVARVAQEGVMEFLLLNHPLDCPVCDKGGECPLQNQAMSVGRPESRFEGEKREFAKPINVSAQILLDRERCVSCARCTRFAEQIAGDPMIELLERGAKQQVGTASDEPFDSYFSGNTVQICPVGALTSASYRFRSRPFDLVSVPTTCEHCASGCSLRTDYRRGVVTRRLAWDDPAVNEEWNCDKGRFAFAYQTRGRLESPLVREDGELRVASWPEAIALAARGLSEARGRVGVLVGGRSTVEDAYAYARFARTALASDDIDFRVRQTSDEETAFLAVRRRRRAGERVLRLPRVRSGRPAGRPRARGRVPDRLPPPAQGRPGRNPRGLRGRGDERGPGQAVRPTHRRASRPGGRGAGRPRRRDARPARPARRRDPGGERIAASAGAASAAVDLARRDRCRPRVGPAPGRRARRPRRRCARRAPARWAPDRGPGGPCRGRGRVERRPVVAADRGRPLRCGPARGCGRGPSRRTHRGRCRARRLPGPVRGPRRRRGGTLRRVAREPPLGCHGPGRCRPAGRRGHGEGGHLPGLGGPSASLRPGLPRCADDVRRPRAVDDRRGDGPAGPGRRPVAARGTRSARPVDRRPPRGPDGSRRPAAVGGRPGLLAPAARLRSHAGRRAPPRGDRTTHSGPGVGGDRREPGRDRHRHRPGVDRSPSRWPSATSSTTWCGCP